jgi:hypothetical protein
MYFIFSLFYTMSILMSQPSKKLGDRWAFIEDGVGFGRSVLVEHAMAVASEVEHEAQLLGARTMSVALHL